MTSRREFLGRIAGVVGAAAMAGAARPLWAQQRGMIHDSSIVRDSANLFAMDQSAALPVRLPAKPGAVPQVSDAERDELERHLHCQCGCTLDVFTCRTTDFSCQVSPAMHRDVVELVRGGYTAQEIIDAFVNVYGERVLMAPTRSGFNLVGWFAPGFAVLAGGVGVFALLRRWGGSGAARAERVRADVHDSTDLDATPEELDRLAATIRGEDRG